MQYYGTVIAPLFIAVTATTGTAAAAARGGTN